MSEMSVVTSMLHRDRWIVIGGLLTIVALSWSYLLQLTGPDMQAMGDMVMPVAPAPWTPGHAALVAFMWAVMMAAMMLPSASPTILLYAGLARRRREREAAVPSAGLFALGYLSVWVAFSFLSTTLQWLLEALLLMSPDMATTSVVLAGAMLIAAGFYQWTPLKQACLRQCRSPLDFLLAHWRAGGRGALAMGARHGLFCLGCCWVLMLLLFVGGIMNLLWIAALALVVLVERIAPGGPWVGRVLGLLLVVWGVAALRRGVASL